MKAPSACPPPPGARLSDEGEDQ
ncbi:hypothetical protein VTJ04DRAFT_4551 [Mycothermus thermophilus]